MMSLIPAKCLSERPIRSQASRNAGNKHQKAWYSRLSCYSSLFKYEGFPPHGQFSGRISMSRANKVPASGGKKRERNPGIWLPHFSCD